MRALLLLPLLLLAACNPPPKDTPKDAPKPDKAVELGPAPDADKVRRAQARFRYREGLKQLEAKQPEAALSAFQDGARLDETYADPHRMIAGLLLQQGKRAEACEAMKRFVELDQTAEPLRARVLESTCTAR